MVKFKQLTAPELHRRLHSLYIPKAIAEGMVTEFLGWIASNGPEWSVKRVKALKTDFIQILAGNGPTSSWIKYKRGVPAGAFGRLFSYGLSSHAEPNQVSRVLNALNIYTSLLAVNATSGQLSKFYDSVKAENVDERLIDEVMRYLIPVVEKLSVDPHVRLRTLQDYNPTSGKRCPSAKGRTVPEKEWLQTISCIWETKLGSNLYYDYSQLREVVNPLAKVVKERLSTPPPWLKAPVGHFTTGFAGKIGHIQEPGFKLRAVANPFRVYQLALSRLGDQLYKLVKSLSWDCTHDQYEGALWAQRKLKESHTLFAVDLSNATDRFPLSLQEKCLRKIRNVNPEDIALLGELSRADWLSPTHGLVAWNKGQPLGLYPSFALFTLTHGILLRGLEQSLGISDSFRVLGDDVVISDPKLHQQYRDILEKLEVPVSMDKTLVSDRITEFAGHIVTMDSIIVIGKWRSVSDRNFMTLLRNIGPRFLGTLQPRQRRVAEMLITLPPPVGLGANPRGLSAERRWLIEAAVQPYIEPRYELPKYGKTSWWFTLKDTEFIHHLFDGLPMEGTWTAIQAPSGSPDPSYMVELHKRLNRLTGVTTLPSLQLRDYPSPYSDVLVLAKRLAAAQALDSRFVTGDPRGTSELELWEQRLKPIKLPI